MLKIYSSIMVVLALTTTIYAGLCPIDTTEQVTQAIMSRIGFNNWPNKNGAILQYNKTYVSNISNYFGQEYRVQYGIYEIIIQDSTKRVVISAYNSCVAAQLNILESILNNTSMEYWDNIEDYIDMNIGDVALVELINSQHVPEIVIKNNYMISYQYINDGYLAIDSINTVIMSLIGQENSVSDIRQSEGAPIMNEIIMPSSIFREWTREEPCMISMVVENWQNIEEIGLQIIDNGVDIWNSVNKGNISDTTIARPLYYNLAPYDSLRIHINSITIYGEIADTTLMLYK